MGLRSRAEDSVFAATRVSAAALVVLVTLLAAGGASAGWTLDDALLPEGLSLEVEHRSRYEFLNDEFRAASTGDTDVFVFRTLLHARADLPAGFAIGAELMDSRAEQNADTILNTTLVNSATLLRAYVEYRSDEIAGGRIEARAGRITMDVGSRRLVARNRYRNTINGFTGVDLVFREAASDAGRGLELRGFWTLPVQRAPDAQSASSRRRRLLDNDAVFDRESLDVQFWGLFGALDVGAAGSLELFVFGLHERDAADRPTRNRQLATPGFRLFRKPAAGRFDYTIENVIQFGQSRTSTTSTQELEHFAHFHHATFAYTFDLAWSPRVALQYDFASGDRNPTDGQNERFDTLFGARRFDFGPTSIYGAFARTNIHSPGLRIQTKPTKRLGAFVAVRGFWLAAEEDTWTTSGLRDRNGNSGAYVGSQFEVRLRYDVLPENVRLEAGYAHLFAGEFIDNAPNSNRQGDSDYVYSSVTLSF